MRSTSVEDDRTAGPAAAATGTARTVRSTLVAALRVPPLTAAGLLAVSVLGLALLVHATQISVGLPPDSATYLGAARSLADGHGYGLETSPPDGTGEPVTQFPPLYPALLALGLALDADPLEVARSLNRGLLVANALLVGVLVFFASGSRGLPVLAAAAVATAPGLLWLHAVALSEPLFLWLAFASLGLLARHLADGSRTGWLVAAGLLAGLALLTRYVGVSLLLAGAWVLIRRSGRPARRRVAEAAGFVGLAALPLCAWWVGSPSHAGAAGTRAFAVHPVGLQDLFELLRTLRSWLLVDLHPAFAVAVAGTGLLWLLDRRRWRAPLQGSGLARVLGAFAVAYAVALLVSKSFFDAATPLNNRILSPLFLVVWTLALLAAQAWMRARPGPWLRVALALLAGLLLSGSALRSLAWAEQRAVAGGVLYGSLAWRQSATLETVRTLPEHVTLYSNGVDAIRLLAGRPARWLPRRFLPATQQPARDLPDRLAEIRATLRAGDAAIVWLDAIRWRSQLLPLAELRRALPVRLARRLPDGTIWVYDPRRDGADGG